MSNFSEKEVATFDDEPGPEPIERHGSKTQCSEVHRRSSSVATDELMASSVEDEHMELNGGGSNYDEDAEVAQISTGARKQDQQRPSFSQPLQQSSNSASSAWRQQQQQQQSSVSPDPNAQSALEVELSAAEQDRPSRNNSQNEGSTYSESFQDDEEERAQPSGPKYVPARPPAPAVGPPSTVPSSNPSRHSSAASHKQHSPPASPPQSKPLEGGSKRSSPTASEAVSQQQPRQQQPFGRSSLGPAASSRSQQSGLEGPAASEPKHSKPGSELQSKHSQYYSEDLAPASDLDASQASTSKRPAASSDKGQHGESCSDEDQSSELPAAAPAMVQGTTGQEQKSGSVSLSGDYDDEDWLEAEKEDPSKQAAASSQHSRLYSREGFEEEAGGSAAQTASTTRAASARDQGRDVGGTDHIGKEQSSHSDEDVPEDDGENEPERQQDAGSHSSAKAAAESPPEQPVSAQSQSSQANKQQPKQQQQRSPSSLGHKAVSHTAEESDDEDVQPPRIELLPQQGPPPQYHHKQQPHCLHTHTPSAQRPTSARPRPASASASISRRSSCSSLPASTLSQHNSSIFNNGQQLHGSLVAGPFTPTSSYFGSMGAHRRPHSAHGRPASAAARGDRHAEVVVDLMRRHPATWGVRDVGMWVDYIGMGQYRKKFMHHSVDGRLLLQISDALLKTELGIGPFGHRSALLEAVSVLSRQAEDAGPNLQLYPMSSTAGTMRASTRPMSARPAPTMGSTGPRRPASASCTGLLPPDAFLGPSMGKVTVYEQRAKLLFELDRAAQRAGQQRTLVQQLTHTAATSGDEVAHLRGLLQDLERRNKLGHGHEVGGLDSGARIPWRPPTAHQVINPHPERFGRPGDDPSLDCTFHPRIRPASHRVVNEAHSQQGAIGSSFMDRLEGDARRREVNRIEAERRWYAPEVMFNDPMLQKNKTSKDTTLINQLLKDLALNRLSPDERKDEALVKRALERAALSSKEAEYEQQINKAVEEHSQEWEMDLQQVRSVLKLKGPKKVAALAGAVRTVQFMHRYSSELNGRDERLQELQRAWWEKYMGNAKQQKDLEDTRQAFEYYNLLGWVGEESVTDERCHQLLRRASALKQALEKAEDRSKGAGIPGSGPASAAAPLIDWNLPPWSQDGLQQLQESNGPPADAAAAATPAKRMSGPPDNNYLAYSVGLLARARWDELSKAEGWAGPVLQLGLYRMLRTQRFIDFTAKNIQAKDQKMREAYESLKPKKRILTKEQVEGFYGRLTEDAAKRNEARRKLVQDKFSKEHNIVESSNMFKKRS